MPCSVKSSASRRPVGVVVYLNHLYTATCPPTGGHRVDSSGNKRESIGPRDAFSWSISPGSHPLLIQFQLVSPRIARKRGRDKEKETREKKKRRSPPSTEHNDRTRRIVITTRSRGHFFLIEARNSSVWRESLISDFISQRYSSISNFPTAKKRT